MTSVNSCALFGVCVPPSDSAVRTPSEEETVIHLEGEEEKGSDYPSGRNSNHGSIIMMKWLILKEVGEGE